MKKNRLAVIGGRLKSVDRLLVHLLAKRVRLSKEVVMIKIEDKAELYRGSIEKDRLDLVSGWAEEEGINPEFARSILYPIIGESCKSQMVVTDKLRLGETVEKFNPSFEELQNNLIELTRLVAPTYDEEYGSGHPATQAIIEYENKMIVEILRDMSGSRNIMLDLGCATGKVMRSLSDRFNNLIGFDISSHMVNKGKEIAEKEHKPNVAFVEANLENKIPACDDSVDFVVMSLGTGSDIQDIEGVLVEIKRVLRKGGRFLISFYNKDAWTQRVFFPWPLGTAAGLDQDRNCLEVHFDNEYLPVFAKPYSMKEVEEILPRGLIQLNLSSYPTFLSLLPAEIIEETGNDVVKKIDGLVNGSGMNLGLYLVLAGQKV